jgi:hypothetical protein
MTPTQPVFTSKPDPNPTTRATPSVAAPVPAETPKPIPNTLLTTPPTNLSSEMTMLLQAFTGFKSEITTAISDLNVKVMELQSGTVPL